MRIRFWRELYFDWVTSLYKPGEAQKCWMFRLCKDYVMRLCTWEHKLSLMRRDLSRRAAPCVIRFNVSDSRLHNQSYPLEILEPDKEFSYCFSRLNNIKFNDERTRINKLNFRNLKSVEKFHSLRCLGFSNMYLEQISENSDANKRKGFNNVKHSRKIRF